MSSRAVFLDRDGTIIVDLDYPKDPTGVTFLSGAVQGLRNMRQKGYLLFVVSNQSGVGRGLIQPQEFEAVHEKFVEILRAQGLEMDGYFYCKHRPEDECSCRKPKAGHLPKTFRGQPIDFARSFVVGDRESDLQLAETLGSKPILVKTGRGEKSWPKLREKYGEKLWVTEDLTQAAQLLP